MRYIIDVKQTNYAVLETEADTIEQAAERAQRMYNAGLVEWEDSFVRYDIHPDLRNRGVRR